MKDRIARRITQLEDEREELRIAAVLRNREIDGQIQALKEVLTALEQPTDEPESVPV